MNLQYLLSDYAAYNLWANKQLIEWLKTKPASVLEREIPSSFPNLKQTLYHIWNAQTWWLRILKQLQPESTYGKEFKGTLEDLFDGLLTTGQKFDNHPPDNKIEALEVGH